MEYPLVMNNYYEIPKKNDGYTWLVCPTTTKKLRIEIGSDIKRMSFTTAIPCKHEDVVAGMLSEYMETAGDSVNVDKIGYMLNEKMGCVAHLTWGDIHIPFSAVDVSVHNDGLMVVAMGDEDATFVTYVDLDMKWADLVVRLLRQRLYENSRNCTDIEFPDIVDSVVDEVKNVLIDV